MLDFDWLNRYNVERRSPRMMDNKALNRSDTCLTVQIVPRMIGYRQLYHPLHSQIQTFLVARLTRALSRLIRLTGRFLAFSL